MRNIELRTYCWKVALILVAGLACSLVTTGLAGELEPPAPPGTPTMKPLNELEPRRPIYAEMLPLTITDAGSSWYLAESITTTGGGILVDADNVTIDLMGYALEGGNGVGIRYNDSGIPRPENNTVRNGTVRGWSAQGILLGFHSTVFQVRALYNSGSGIEVSDYSHVVNSTVSYNSLHGIVAGYASIVRDCVATHNTQNGIWGFVDVLIVNCVADNNYRNGFRVDHACRLLQSSAVSNSLAVGHDYAGIRVTGNNNRIDGNTIITNENGLALEGNHNVVVQNSAHENSTDNYRIAPGTTGNLIGEIVTTMTGAGPWVNFCTGGTCP